MGTRDRRERERNAREQEFLETARRQIREQGLLALRMASVARACDYATGTLYQHFASKEDLLLALCAEQAVQRVEILQRAGTWQVGSRERMFALVIGDMLFAQSSPDHFRLTQYVFTDAVWGAASAERRQAVLDAHAPIAALVGGIVDDAVRSGDLECRGRGPLELAIGQWSMTIGMHTLVHASGVLEFFHLHQPYSLLLRHAQIHFNGLGWKPLMDPFDDTQLQASIDHVCATLYPDLERAGAEPEPNVTTGE